MQPLATAKLLWPLIVIYNQLEYELQMSYDNGRVTSIFYKEIMRIRYSLKPVLDIRQKTYVPMRLNIVTAQAPLKSHELQASR